MPKVAIPRLLRSDIDRELGLSVAANKQRASRACTPCRKQKVKCTGEAPRCSRCENSNQSCTYVKGRRDLLKTANEQIANMARVLNHLKAGASKEDQRKIDALLEAAEDNAIGVVSAGKRSALTRRMSSESDNGHGEGQVSAGVGSNGFPDFLDEDLVRTERARATGFVGKSSEIQWWRDLRYDLENRLNSEDDPPREYGPPGVSEAAFAARIDASRRCHPPNTPSNIDYISSSSFYLDDDNIQLDLNFVDQIDMPPQETAERLMECYISTVQDSFPILPKKWLEEVVHKLYDHLRGGWSLELVDDRILAILNSVFAIGTKFCHLVTSDGQTDDLDHLIYQARARMLGFKDSVIIAHHDIHQVRLAGLLSFYFLSIGQISRAWYTIGIAVRSAYALGLHIRNEDPAASVIKREYQVRTWWALYCLERVLCTITGRPSIVLDECCAVPLPLPLADYQLTETTIMRQADKTRYKTHSLYTTTYLGTGSSTHSTVTGSTAAGTPVPSYELPNSGIYLNSRVKIDVIIGKVLARLYMPEVVTISWEKAQVSMTELSAGLEEWICSLPPAFDFRHQSTAAAFRRERMSLGLNYLSAKMLITWPCLCKLGPVDRRIKKQTRSSTSFDLEMAEACVEAAKALTSMLPDCPDPIFLYRTGPWWSIVHNFMQALAVLMLEMAYKAIHMMHNGQMIELCVKKLIRWLGAMKERDRIADKAYKMALVILHKVASRVDADISDLFREDLPDFFTLLAPSSPNPYKRQKRKRGNSEEDSGVRC
ncbi:hypothetical protein K469DRAFT_664510 [Zopfia rhizophila CBS 207.26]|uniref:Zn(2)-C6 fungal-type domain-containing protein n=1 Tax=Zopfia rhizophila CBS 207.26 TaxID=1314779 RepID=A0A6A6E766_9PEZI|nr:hypothetical protein K469DRAFT_664510 [Zopfia rhizophila CBS 207.26]